jgi:hypothetical protein
LRNALAADTALAKKAT